MHIIDVGLIILGALALILILVCQVLRHR